MEFMTITLFIILAAISPGPDFAIVSRNALAHSRLSGYFTALGVSMSILFHASYCLLGLGLIISQSLIAFSIIKYIGAAYLIYLGIKGIMAKRTETDTLTISKTTPITRFRSFNQGFLCNVLNPKAILFLLAFFTLIIKPGTPISLQAIYAIEIAVIHLIWFSLLTTFLTHSEVQSRLHRFQHAITKVLGGFLIACGVRIATME